MVMFGRVPAGIIPFIRYVPGGAAGVSYPLVEALAVAPGDTVVIPYPQWRHSMRLYLNTTASGAGVTRDVVNFPALIRLTENNFDFNQALDGGKDIRFSTPEGASLAYEIEVWDATAKRAALWVRIPVVRGNDSSQYIVMHWGAITDNVASLSNGAAVFDTAAGFEGVWHLSGTGNSIAYDATVNGLHGIPFDMNAASMVAGAAGYARYFNGAGSHIVIANSASGELDFKQNGEYSVSLWAYADTIDTLWHALAGKGHEQYYLKLKCFGNGKATWEFVEFQDQKGWEFTEDSVPPAPGAKAWVYLTGVRSGKKQYLYINGTLASDETSLMAGKNNYKGQTEVLDQDYGLRATAVSVLVSTKGYGIFWDSYAKINFYGNISNNTPYAFSSECGDVLDYYFFYGPEIDKVVSGYRTATGKVPLFPKWAYGLIQSKDRYTSQAEIFSVKDGYRNNKIPLDCIVQDWHYWDGAGKQGCYCFNSSYGNVKTTITTLHNANIHTMISIWSQLEEVSPPFNNFNSKGWLWPSDGATHFIDAYNSDAREEFWRLIRNAFFDPNVQGWDAWWLDNDEPFPYPNGFNRRTLTTAMGKGVLFYNSYTFPMSEMGYKNWRRDIPNKRFVMLHRANFAGQQAHSTMQWNNDIDCNFQQLTASVPSGLNSTLCGIPYWCTDIGGYWGVNADFTTATNQELMVRWLQYGAFQPVFRIHGNMKAGQGHDI